MTNSLEDQGSRPSYIGSHSMAVLSCIFVFPPSVKDVHTLLDTTRPVRGAVPGCGKVQVEIIPVNRRFRSLTSALALPKKWLCRTGFCAANSPIKQWLHSLKAQPAHPNINSGGFLRVETLTVVAAFDRTRFVIGVALTVFADTRIAEQAVIMGPVFPSAKSLPDEFGITPSFSMPELPFRDFRQCSWINHAMRSIAPRSIDVIRCYH